MAISKIRPMNPVLIEAADTSRKQNGDLNSLSTIGMHEVWGTITHGPTQTSVADANVVNFQTTQLLVAGGTDNKIFVRSKNGTTWTAWQEFINEAWYYYKASDTFSTSELLPCTGYITHGSDRIYLSLYVDKSLKNISSISVTTLSGSIRTVEGKYITDTTDTVNWLTGNTVTAVKATDRAVRIMIQFAEAPTNAVNNTPVTGALNIGLSFS